MDGGDGMRGILLIALPAAVLIVGILWKIRSDMRAEHARRVRDLRRRAARKAKGGERESGQR